MGWVGESVVGCFESMYSAYIVMAHGWVGESVVGCFESVYSYCLYSYGPWAGSVVGCSRACSNAIWSSSAISSSSYIA